MPEQTSEQVGTLNAAIQESAGDQADASPAGQELTEAVGAGETVEPAEQAGPTQPEVAFSWQASEYVHHHKNVGWYATLIGAVIVLMVLAVWLHLWLEIGAFIMMTIAVIVYASKAPRTMLYELSSEGIHINGRIFSFAEFRSFSVMPDDEWHAIDLEPAKRFSPRVVLLFDTEDFDQIVGHLELHLPRVDRQPDMIEWITRYLRF